MKRSLFILALVWLLTLTVSGVQAVQFPYLDPTYNQQIFSGTNAYMGVLGAWTPGGNLLSRSGSSILEYSSSPNVTYQSTLIHSAVIHNISGLSGGGYGITNGLDGYVYADTPAGLQRFDPTNWAAPAQSLPGTQAGLYGITTLPDGRIAYSDGTNSSNVWLYNPGTSTNTLIYTGTSLIDGMVSGPTGNIAVTQHNYPAGIVILNSSGGVVNSFATTHYPDGLAFAASPLASILYSNNNDGTISKYAFPSPGYVGVPVITDIASGSQAYGDLAVVGPDCAFYVSQSDNGGQNGSTAGIGTHWGNVTTTVTDTEPSIIRIGGGVMHDGTTVCEFYSPLTGFVAPEPASLGLLTAGSLLLLGRRKRA